MEGRSCFPGLEKSRGRQLLLFSLHNAAKSFFLRVQKYGDGS